MKAILMSRYGGPEVLSLQDIPIPTPKDDEVLIRVQAAATNAADWHLMRASPWLVRLSDGWLNPKDPRLGADVVGTITAVGENVTQFVVGDEVYGENLKGTFAEYVVAPTHRIAKKPHNLGAAAATIPLSGMTALQGLRDSGRIATGQNVLINGASGGVGHYAVQIAKAFGATVTAVCSGRNADWVRALGADQVIDYTQEDFTQTQQRYDLVFDTVANRSVRELQPILTPTGRAMLCGFSTLGHMLKFALHGALKSSKHGQTLGVMTTAQAKQADLDILRDYVEAGKLAPHIDREYTLAEVPDAIRYMETGRARGKVLIRIAD